MKKLLILSLAFLFVFSACQDELTDLNTDSKNPTEVPAPALIANATVTLFDFMTSTNVNVNNFRLWAQQWAQTTYADESNYELTERNVNGRVWDRMYASVIRDLREAKPIIEADAFLTAENKKNQVAIANLVEILAFSILVDIFGDIPYTEALSGTPSPKYDDDTAIYAALASRLDSEVINQLSGDSGLGGEDLVYAGNTDSWKKMANSLKLRMAIRMADVDATTAGRMASEAAAGAFASNGDNFQLSYASSTPNTNPLWEDLVQSGRSDFIAGNTIVDMMNSLDDPRIGAYFKDQQVVGTDTIIDAMTGDTTFVDIIGYKGGVVGDNNSFNTNSHPGELLLDPTFPGVVMDYSEVAFLMADAVERGFISGTAEDYYNAGITASIMQWTGSDATAAAYLAQPAVAYTSAAGDWKEKIATQKWLAMYNRGFEAWTTYRIYDAPTLQMAAQAERFPPVRYTYPVTEYSLNGDNVAAAAAAIGADDLDSKVFWDAN